MNPKKKPKFIRQGTTYLKRLGEKWRAPKGKQNKLRQHQLSKGNYPHPGYGSPKSLKFLHPSGFQEIMIRNLKDLEKVNPKTQAIRIASAIGRKKRLEIMKIANEKKLKILNPLKQEAVK
jgi:large subunit ribosomal protein L32e